MQTTGKITLNSPGKINLHLAVGEKRADGFHALESAFTAIDFADSLTFSVLPGNEAITRLTVRKEGPLLELSQKGQYFPAIPTEKNIVFLASQLFRLKTGLKTNLGIELIKHIPPGSGLGGGSSNAAATLLALNEFAGNSGEKLSGDELLGLASQLGSDVPFFVEITLQSPEKSPARFVSGRGEIFDFLPSPPQYGILLVFPGFASHTGAAYNLLDENRVLLNQQAETNALFRKEFSWNFPDNWNFSNDFQELFLKFGPEQEKESYNVIFTGLKKAGAAFSGLSGSGSCCFGIFSTIEEAAKAERALSGSFYVLKSTFFLRDS